MRDISNLYSDFSKDAAEAEADALATGFFKWQDGMNQVRFMPATPGMKLPWVVAWQHSFNTDDGEFVVINCPRSTPGEHDKTCLACEYIERLRVSPSPDDRKKADEMRVSPRAFAKVVDRKNERRGPQVVGLSGGIHKRLLEFRNSPKFNTNFTDPVKGTDVFVDKTGTGLATRYTTDLSREDNALAQTEEQMIEWLEKSIDMDLQRYALPDLVASQREKLQIEDRGVRREALPAKTIDVEATENNDDIPF